MMEIVEKEKSGEVKGQRRKTKSGSKELSVNAGTSLPLSCMEEIESLARKHEIRIAKVLRQFVLRGLAAYHRDGLLDEPSE